MELSVTLQHKIVNFLTSLPNIHDNMSQQALIYQAGLDQELQNQINFGAPPVQFFSLLVPLLFKYGRIQDGRNALEALLEAAKQYVGQEKKRECENLIEKLSRLPGVSASEQPLCSSSVQQHPISHTPYTILKDAIKAVSVVKYALGVAGIAGTVAIVAGFQINYQVAVFGTLIMLGFMFVLLVFSAATKYVTGKPFYYLVLTLTWCFTIVAMSVAALLLTSYFFMWPRGIDEYLPSKSTPTPAVADRSLNNPFVPRSEQEKRLLSLQSEVGRIYNDDYKKINQSGDYTGHLAQQVLERVPNLGKEIERLSEDQMSETYKLLKYVHVTIAFVVAASVEYSYYIRMPNEGMQYAKEAIDSVTKAIEYGEQGKTFLETIGETERSDENGHAVLSKWIDSQNIQDDIGSMLAIAFALKAQIHDDEHEYLCKAQECFNKLSARYIEKEHPEHNPHLSWGLSQIKAKAITCRSG